MSIRKIDSAPALAIGEVAVIANTVMVGCGLNESVEILELTPAGKMR